MKKKLSDLSSNLKSRISKKRKLNITEKLPKLIKDANNENWMHVFLINNPVVLIVSTLLIKALKIDKNKILILSIRGIDTSLTGLPYISLSEKWFYRLLRKFTHFKPLTTRALNSINKTGKKFILYVAWDYEESVSTPCVRSIINNPMCVGHCYLEEGQQSYRPIKPYSLINKEKPLIKKHTKFKDDEDRLNHRLYYGEDAIAFFGLFEDVYPNIPSEKVFLCNDFNVLKKLYKPHLLNVENIAISCAERRLNKNGLDFMLRALVSELPDGGVIKLHPSFIGDKKKVQLIEKKLTLISNGNVTLAPLESIIEIEMLFSQKKLIGSLTSLIRYATNLGSSFKEIKLY